MVLLFPLLAFPFCSLAFQLKQSKTKTKPTSSFSTWVPEWPRGTLGLAVRPSFSLLTCKFVFLLPPAHCPRLTHCIQLAFPPLRFCGWDVRAGPTPPPARRYWPGDEFIPCLESLPITSAFWTSARCLYLTHGSDHVIT